MGITALFSEVYYEGGAATSTEVPGLYPIGLGGHTYLVDLQSGAFKRQTIPLLRNQADQSNLPGEQSINPDDLWRRAQESWHKGAGQQYLDRQESDAARFRSSKGINVWDRWQITLLNDTGLKLANTSTDQFVVVAGSRLYYGVNNSAGVSVRYTTDVSVGSPTFTNVTGTPAVNVSSIASDGYYVYIAYGASGIYLTNVGSSAAASWITGTATLVGYVKGRLMVASGAALYNVTTSTGTAGPTALPAALYTHPNPQWTWVGFAEGQVCLYAAGYAGDKSIIYKTPIKPDGTALDIPTVAGELPDGEIIRSIQGYLGYIVIGTDYGIRFAVADGQGNLSVGPLTRTAKCQAFEPQDRFVYFGWNNYDGASTGLGRMDLSVFTSPMAPAYASDLMATTQGAITSIATVFQGGSEWRVFTVSGVGVYANITDKVASGSIDSGQVTYGIPDEKVVMFLDVRTEPLVGSYEAFLSVDGGAFESIGTHATSGSQGTVFPADQERARRFELRLVLNRSASATTTGPTLNRQTLRAYAAPNRGELFMVPLVFHETLMVQGIERSFDVQGELEFIRQLIRDHLLVQYQDGENSHSVFVEDYEWTPHHQTRDGLFWNGLCTIRLKEVVA